jgi:hypothetical protein
MNKSTLGSLLVLFAACNTSPDLQTGPNVTVVGDTTFLELQVGTSATNGEIRVAFDAVTEDSRCPTDVQCVWEGNGGIRLTLTGGDQTGVFIVNSSSDPRLVGFQGFALGFSDLRPYPVSTQAIDPDDYVATISIVDTR